MAGRVLIAGIGNDLMGDDGLGPAVIARLVAKYELPAGVDAVDVGTGGFDLMDYLAGRRAAILIDVVEAEGVAAGTVLRYGKQDLTGPPPPLRLSPHQPTLREAILAADLLGGGVEEVVLLGVVAGSLEMGEGLSRAVADALPALEALLLEELRRLGVEPRRRGSELRQ